MIRVIFVCAGNICRSPMAEAVFRHLVAEAGLADHIETASAGTGDWHVGEPPHRGTQEILTQHGVTWQGQRARRLGTQDLLDFDYVVVMDRDNLFNVETMARRVPATGEISRLTDWADPADTNGFTDVPDPFYAGGFDGVYKMVFSGCTGLLGHIRQAHKLPPEGM
ncbi:MAG: low molecular weight protein-tyrosine-phosphatase [Caldilineaceae bacterium]